MKKNKALLITLVIISLTLCCLFFCLICYQEIMCTTPTIWYPSIKVFQANKGYRVFFHDGEHIDGYVYFSTDKQLLRSWNINVVNENRVCDFLGKHMEEITKEYGCPHGDVGSGFSFPTYITSKANLIVIYENKNIVNKIVVKDLIANIIIDEYELAENEIYE